MNLPDQALYLASLISLIVVGPLVGISYFLFVSYRKLVQRFANLETRDRDLTDGALKEAQNIIENASKQAHQLITHAEKEVPRIDMELSNALKSLSELQLKKFEAALAASAESVLGNYGKALEEALQKNMKELNSDVEKYRKIRIDAIDKDIAAMATKLSKTYLGRSLSEEEQIRLVDQALEQAKRENVL